jgi:transmembrane sensor
MNSIESTFGIGRLIAKHLTDALDAGEQNQLDAWLKEDEKHTAIFNRIVAHESLAAALIEMQQVNTELALVNVKSRISTLAERNPVRLWPRIVVAAAAVAAITLGTWLYMNGPDVKSGDEVVMNDIAPGKNGATITLANGKVIQLSDAKSGVVIGNGRIKYNDGSFLSPSGRDGVAREGSGPVNPLSPQGDPDVKSGGGMALTASTAKGQTYQFTLPDGTKVWLNADSKLEFPSNFVNSKTRNVKLSGEGYFEVAKDKAHPFIVATDQQEVEVLGTHFNINSYSDESNTKTTLLEGSVRVNEVVLKPNQQSILTGSNRIKVQDVDIEEAIAWKNGKFVFEYENIESVMRKLSRWYDAEIIYQGNIGDKTFTGSISRRDNISKILEKITYTQNVHFKIEGRRITVML